MCCISICVFCIDSRLLHVLLKITGPIFAMTEGFRLKYIGLSKKRRSLFCRQSSFNFFYLTSFNILCKLEPEGKLRLIMICNSSC